MRNYGMALALAAAAIGLGGPNYGLGRRRDFTLDEVEEQSVHRMLQHARHRRNMAARAMERHMDRINAAEAARIEAERPKSRQELRAVARKRDKRLREDRCFQKGERRP